MNRYHHPAALLDERIRGFYRVHRSRFVLATAFALLGWCGGLVETYILLRLLSPGHGWGTALAIETLAMTLNNLFLFIPARLGSAEGVRVAVFVLLGLPAAQGMAYGLVRRGRELVWVLPGLQDPVRDVYVISAADALDAGSRATSARTHALRTMNDVLAIEASALPERVWFACSAFMTLAVPLS